MNRLWLVVLMLLTQLLSLPVYGQMPTPPPAPGGNQTGLKYCLVQLPGPGYHVVAKYYDASCAAIGGLCDTRTYVAGMNGVAWVPLVYADGPFLFFWWDKVRMEFPAYTPGAFFDASLDYPVELFPDSRPEDRWLSYTIGYDPDVVRVLNRVCDIKTMSQRTIGYSRGSMEIRWSDSPSYSDGDYMNLPDMAYFDYWGPDQGPQLFDFILAHEYYHGIQNSIFGGGGRCTEVHDNFWQLFYADCAAHDGCHTGQSIIGSFTEGTADAFATFIKRKMRGESLNPELTRSCWEIFPDEAEMIGPGRELNIDAYYYRLLALDPVGTFNTFRYGRITEVGGQTHPATTITQYYSLWSDQDQEANRWIGVHHPGTWSTELYYRHYIYAQDVSAVETPPYPGFTEYEKVRWIRHISPNPVSGRTSLQVHALVPGSGDVQLSIFSVTGRLITQKRFPNLPSGQEHDFRVHLPSIPSGVYLVHYEDAAKHRVEDSAKFLVVK